MWLMKMTRGLNWGRLLFFVEQFIFYSILPDRKSSLGEQSLELGGGVRCVLVDWNKVLNILG